jgi:hypothetical protein
MKKKWVRVVVRDGENGKVMIKVTVKNGVEELRTDLLAFKIDEVSYDFNVADAKVEKLDKVFEQGERKVVLSFFMKKI